MSDDTTGESPDRAPGAGEESPRKAVLGYLGGLGAATLLTIASFGVAAGWGGVWTPGIPMALMALAVGSLLLYRLITRSGNRWLT